MSIFPFGMQDKEARTRKRETMDRSAGKDQILAEYRDLLDRYRACIAEYSGIYDEISKKAVDNRLSTVQLAVDITYIKDMLEKLAGLLEEARAEADNVPVGKLMAQNDKLLGQIESLTASVIETHYNLDGVDKNAVNRLSDILLELQKQTLYQYKQSMADIQDNLEKLKKSVGHNRVWGVLSFVLQLIGLGGIVFIILYLLEIIV